MCTGVHIRLNLNTLSKWAKQLTLVQHTHVHFPDTGICTYV